MATLRATAILNRINKEPADAVRNVWHFSTGGAIVAGDMTTVGDALTEFYNQLSTTLSSSFDRAVNAHRFEFAEVTRGGAGEADDVVSALLGSRNYTMVGGAAVATDLPSEVAICMSMNGDLTGLNEEEGLIRPKSRRRGRLYLGPWTTAVAAKDASTNRTGVATAHRTKILDSYESALSMLNGLAGRRIVNHIVYSRASANVHPVVGVSVDDAFDTIRTRGEKRVVKDSRAVVPAALVP